MSARVRILTLLASACLAGTLVVAAGSASPHRASHKSQVQRAKTPSSFFGVVPQEQPVDSDYSKMSRNGVKVLRFGLYWQQVQPLPLGSGIPLPGLPVGPSYDFSRFDATVAGAAKQGITVLPYLYGVPNWVALLDGRVCTDCRQYAPSSTAALSAWSDFAAAAAARYGPKGTFWKDEDNSDIPKKPIRDWQIWNEQNFNGFYKPEPDPKEYFKVLSSAAQGLRSEDRKANIVLGGMFGLPGNGSVRSIAAPTFLRKLLKIPGAKSIFDGYALHPYSKSLKYVKKLVTASRSEMKRSGYGKAQLWITETGAASGGKPSSLNLGSKKAQAKRVTDTYKLFEKNRKAWNIKLVAWFAWQDSSGEGECFFCKKAGLITKSGKSKPSLNAFKRATK